jgi:hypothetical protein
VKGAAVRDLWRQKDLGTCAGSFSADVTRHGVVLVQLDRPAANRLRVDRPYGLGGSRSSSSSLKKRVRVERAR